MRFGSWEAGIGVDGNGSVHYFGEGVKRNFFGDQMCTDLRLLAGAVASRSLASIIERHLALLEI